jgi:hypothetical protein
VRKAKDKGFGSICFPELLQTQCKVVLRAIKGLKSQVIARSQHFSSLDIHFATDIREWRIANIRMNLKPQDILVLLKLVDLDKKPWSFNKLAANLGMSSSEVHAAAKRALAARLAVKEGENIRPNIRNLEDFLAHGIQYVFVPERDGLTRGMPTAHACAPLDAWFVDDNEPPPVWPDPEGEVGGESFSPLYKSVPVAAKNDPRLYQLLALVDAIRGGRAREREIATKALKKLFGTEMVEKNSLKQNERDQLVVGGVIEVSRSD